MPCARAVRHSAVGHSPFRRRTASFHSETPQLLSFHSPGRRPSETTMLRACVQVPRRCPQGCAGKGVTAHLRVLAMTPSAARPAQSHAGGPGTALAAQEAQEALQQQRCRLVMEETVCTDGDDLLPRGDRARGDRAQSVRIHWSGLLLQPVFIINVYLCVICRMHCTTRML